MGLLPELPREIPTRLVCFEYLDDLTIEFRPAVLDLNPVFRACAFTYLRPLTLATLLPDDHPRRLSDLQARQALAKVYGLSVVTGSPSHDAFDAKRPEEWAAWLVEQEWEFETLASLAAIGTNFDPDYRPLGEAEAALPAADQAHVHAAQPAEG